MRRPQLRSPLARAVVPVLGGLGVLALIGLFTFGLAVYISGNDPDDTGMTPSELHLGAVDDIADEIAENGPLLFPGLDTVTGERSIVVDHRGDVPDEGWKVTYAYPADRDRSCHIEQLRENDPSKFVDCEGRTLETTDLADPTKGEHPELREGKTELWLVLRSPDDAVAPVTTG